MFAVLSSMRRLPPILLLLLPMLLLLGCEGQDTGMSRGYMDDPSVRRAELEAALWLPDLRYSRGLLSNYALERGGWELLPEMTGESAPLTLADVDRLAARQPLTLDVDPLPGAGLPGVDLPTEPDDWIALGQQVFERLPMRYDPYLTWLATRPDVWAQVGLPVEGGTVRGLVKYRDDRGAVQVGIACALCHGAQSTPGRGDRRLDLGLARRLFNEANGIDSPLVTHWGPGRVDVSEDGVDAPLSIPDLWGVRYSTWLNSSGVIRVSGPATLAIRFETQYIKGHRMGSRPARAWTWALAQFVMSLEPPTERGIADAADAQVFELRCAGCHDPDRGFAGDLVAADALLTDPRAANSPTRGTGHYKVPSLLGVTDAAPYLHDGRVPSLDALLREGHPFGDPIDAAERAALLRFLDTL
ncbi:MAG: mono/diheme cytochrome c family protein [Bradymonadia bacterium]|jgi:mono/diheme cytochrome c family protein